MAHPKVRLLKARRNTPVIRFLFLQTANSVLEKLNDRRSGSGPIALGITAPPPAVPHSSLQNPKVRLPVKLRMDFCLQCYRVDLIQLRREVNCFEGNAIPRLQCSGCEADFNALNAKNLNIHDADPAWLTAFARCQ
ncbi:hypothetical protein [Microvirga tunisiensis]|uniref:hypothetical protein n=1 Tax=Microvirga tunisiensis TaxID=2108360 RepID=UPI00128CBD12|nr:hypothetical protein [Microvirga tunisiensis]MPR13174.1 hypothetical protein [Microvirga tunisiensis]